MLLFLMVMSNKCKKISSNSTIPPKFFRFDSRFLHLLQDVQVSLKF